MSIQNEQLYPKYLLYLESKKLSRGGFALSKMSTNLFEEFVFRFENNPTFQDKINNLYKSIDREEKIDNLVKDDFELFMEEMGEEIKIESKNDENFFDF
jgi:hypothetical protein